MARPAAYVLLLLGGLLLGLGLLGGGCDFHNATPRMNGGTDSTIFVNSIGMEFRRIPAGAFEMGSFRGEDDEAPPHDVSITEPFYMGAHEVKQLHWRTLMDDTLSQFRGIHRPVENVSWYQARAFVDSLNAREETDRSASHGGGVGVRSAGRRQHPILLRRSVGFPVKPCVVQRQLGGTDPPGGREAQQSVRPPRRLRKRLGVGAGRVFSPVLCAQRATGPPEYRPREEPPRNPRRGMVWGRVVAPLREPRMGATGVPGPSAWVSRRPGDSGRRAMRPGGPSPTPAHAPTRSPTGASPSSPVLAARRFRVASPNCRALLILVDVLPCLVS